MTTYGLWDALAAMPVPHQESQWWSIYSLILQFSDWILVPFSRYDKKHFCLYFIFYFVYTVLYCFCLFYFCLFLFGFYLFYSLLLIFVGFVLFYFSFCFVCLFFGFVFCIIRRVMNIHEKFEDTKEVITTRKSKKGGQHNDQKKKEKRTNNDLQNIYIQLKID